MELSSARARPVTHDLSLGELQSLCVKATRGAGRAVGVTEDAGRAVRWLHARGEDGASALVQLLVATDEADAADIIPDLPAFTPVKQAICPLALGGYLSDMEDVPDGPIGPVWTPILMRPFLADLTSNGVNIAPRAATDPVIIQLMPRQSALMPTHSRAKVSNATMDALLAFAARTYAPATEQSRAGAGAGVSDND